MVHVRIMNIRSPDVMYYNWPCLLVYSDVEAMNVPLTLLANCFSLTYHANCCLVDAVLRYMTTEQI